MHIRTVHRAVVTATLAATFVCVAGTDAREKQAVTITLKAPDAIHANRAWKVTGTVTGAETPVTGEWVRTFITVVGEAGNSMKVAPLNPDGTFTAKWHLINILEPGTTLKFKVTYLGDETHKKATSKSVKIRVKR
jgi:hypothetical protein